VAGVFKLLLFDRTGNRTTDRTPFQDLAIDEPGKARKRRGEEPPVATRARAPA
jgi:hypothetical protein